MMAIGFLIGNLVFSPLGDKYGRKITINISIFVIFFLNIAIWITSNSALLFVIWLINSSMIAIFLSNTLVYIL